MGTQSISQLVAEISIDLARHLTWQALSIVFCIADCMVYLTTNSEKVDKVGETSDVVEDWCREFFSCLVAFVGVGFTVLNQTVLGEVPAHRIAEIIVPNSVFICVDTF